MWCITLIDLQILKNPCIPGIKPTWSWCMIFLMCCWILIARILLRKILLILTLLMLLAVQLVYCFTRFLFLALPNI